MKRIIIISVLLISIFGLTTFINFGEANSDIVKSGMITAFDFQQVPYQNLLDQGRAEAFGKYFGEEVLISITGNEEMVDKKEAIQMLKMFFLKHQPIGFELIHKGESPSGNGKYITGVLNTVTGKFKTNMMTEKGKILEMEFTKKK